MASRFLITPAYDSSGTLYDDVDVAFDGALADTTVEWNATDVGIWSATSGGTAGASVPGISDAVILDANSPSVKLSTNISIASLDLQVGHTEIFDAVTFNITVSGDVTMKNSNTKMGTGTWTVSGNWDSVGVTTFDEGGSLLVLNGTSKTIAADSTMRNITIDGTITHITSCIVARNYIVNASKTSTVNSGQTLDMRSVGSDVQVASSGTITGSGTLFIDDKASITQQDGTIDVATLTIQAGHDGAANTLIVAATYASATVNIQADGSGGLVSFNFSSGTTTFTGNVNFIGQNVNGYNIDNSANNPNLVFQGNVTVTEPTGAINWTAGTGTITIDKAGDQTIDWLGKSVENTTIAGSGIKTFNGGATWGTFTFAGSGVTSHKFEIAKTFQFDTALNSNGTSGAQSVIISTTGGSTANFNLQGTSNLEDKVNVKDIDASSGNQILAIGSTDSGNNPNWKFVGVSIVSHERGINRGVIRGVLEGV